MRPSRSMCCGCWRAGSPRTHPERAEATGLLGRAYKQIFFDAGDKSTAPSRRRAEGGNRRLPRALRGQPRQHVARDQPPRAAHARAAARCACARKSRSPRARGAAGQHARCHPAGRTRRVVPANPGRSFARARRLERRRSGRPRVRGRRARQGLPGGQHAAAVHRDLGSRTRGRARARSREHPAGAPGAAAGRGPRSRRRRRCNACARRPHPPNEQLQAVLGNGGDTHLPVVEDRARPRGWRRGRARRDSAAASARASWCAAPIWGCPPATSCSS